MLDKFRITEGFAAVLVIFSIAMFPALKADDAIDKIAKDRAQDRFHIALMEFVGAIVLGASIASDIFAA